MGADRHADALSTFVFEGAAVRGALVSLDASCRDVLACRAYPPALRRVVAELLAASALLASALKFKGKLAVQLQGDGPVRMLVVECDAALCLRATAQWNPLAETMAADADLATLSGGPAHARLALTLDPGDGGPLYQGIVGLEAASVAALIEHYLTRSEQVESRLVLAAQDDRVRGLLVQRMPGAGPAADEAWRRAAEAARTFGPARLYASADPASLLTACFPESDLRLFDARPARFACQCSEARIGNALRLIGRDEAEDILAEQGVIEMTCEFCNRRYTLGHAEVRALFGDGDPDAVAPRGGTAH
jgi:molecular chaperone Hsp33